MKAMNIRSVSPGVRVNEPRRSATNLLSSLTLGSLCIAAFGFLGLSCSTIPLQLTPAAQTARGNAGGSDIPDALGDTGGAVTLPVPGTTIHVSPTGDDANDGLLTPVKTLKHAIGLAAADPTITGTVLVTGGDERQYQSGSSNETKRRLQTSAA